VKLCATTKARAPRPRPGRCGASSPVPVSFRPLSCAAHRPPKLPVLGESWREWNEHMPTNDSSSGPVPAASGIVLAFERHRATTARHAFLPMSHAFAPMHATYTQHAHGATACEATGRNAQPLLGRIDCHSHNTSRVAWTRRPRNERT
jgi:hypothetical protein